jgi:hypothetical protein
MTSTHVPRPARGTTFVDTLGRTLFVSLVQQNRHTGEVWIYVRDAARPAERVEYIVEVSEWETFLDEHVAPEVVEVDETEPVIVRAGEVAPLAQYDAPRQVGGCDCSAVPGPHLVHCDDCSAPVDRCVCREQAAAEALLDAVEERAEQQHAEDEADREYERLAVLGGYGLPAARAQEAEHPVHYTREQIAARFREVDSFVLVLGPDDRAYDPETGDTLLGGVTVRYARGEFPGPSYTATIVDDEPAVDDDPREQPAPLEWSEHAGS